MGFFDWVYQIALKKAVGKGLKSGVASFTGLTAGLAQYGIHVEINQALLISSLISGGVFGYEFIRNFLKGKGLNFLP